MRKIIQTITLILLLSISASASQYKYKATEELDTTTLTGNVSIGRLILQRQITNKTNHTTNMTVNITLPIYDRICNDANETISIVGHQLLLSGDCYELTSVGKKVLVGLLTNRSTFADVTQISNPRINLSFIGAFPVIFSKNNFELSGDDEVFLNLSLPFELLPGAYKYTYKINSDSYENDFTVLSHNNWTADYLSIMSNVSLGSTGELGSIIINNKGNSYSTITITSDNILVSVPNKVISYAGLELEVPVTYNVPRDYATQNNTYKLTLTSSNGQIKVFTDRLLTVDNEKPVISNLKMGTGIEAIRPFNITINATDNSEIKKYRLTITINGSIVFEEEQEQPTFNITLDDTGTHTAKARAYDSSDNYVDYNTEFNVKKLSAINAPRSIRLSKTKFDLWKKNYLMSSDYPVYIGVKLIDIDYNSSFKIRLETKDETFTINQVNNSVFFNDFIGNMTMEIQGSKLGFYSGTLQLILEDNHEAVSNINFNGEFINYSIYDDFEQAWLDGLMKVDYVNVEDFDNARTKLVIDYPGLIPRENLATPLTPKYKEEIDRSHMLEVQTLKDKNTSKIIWNILLFILLIISVLFTVWVVTIRPNLLHIPGGGKAN